MSTKTTAQKNKATSEPAAKKQKTAAPTWEEFFFKLVLYKHKHGTFIISAEQHHISDDYTALAEWIELQQKKYSRGKLTQDQISVLNEIGFVWNFKEQEQWQERFEELLEYKQEHGDTLVPSKTRLGKWVCAQRAAKHKKDTGDGGDTHEKTSSKSNSNRKPIKPITQEREDKLNNIGFVWRVHNSDGWDARFQELREYKETYGHTRVPQHWPANKFLGKWVARQRYQYTFVQQNKPNCLSQERIDLLNSLNFDWGKVRPSARKEENRYDAPNSQGKAK